MQNDFLSISQTDLIEVEDNSIEQSTNQRQYVPKSHYSVIVDIWVGDSNFEGKFSPLISNCNGQYFSQNCIKCNLLLKIWCTEWKACPKCGTKNYGRHYGA